MVSHGALPCTFLNFALLVTHQIDSAYWKEWELFHLPGGAAQPGSELSALAGCAGWFQSDFAGRDHRVSVCAAGGRRVDTRVCNPRLFLVKR